MKREIRIPKQKRSIEKKNKLINTAFSVFSEKGYYNTNTAEIAKQAGISTGSLYAYFEDKQALFFEVLNNYSEMISNIIINRLARFYSAEHSLNEIIRELIDAFIESHNISQSFHEEVVALGHLDENIRAYLSNQQQTIVQKFIDLFKTLGYDLIYERENFYCAYLFIDLTCHELIFNSNSLNRDAMINICVKTVVNLLEKQ
ncbi:MAG: TetR/AcrR family transcriptional regulator [Bacillota bacterium]